MVEKIKVFISYSRQDKGQIDQLYQALLGDDELEVFLDEHDIAAAENWKTRLETLIRSADTVIFATSPASAASDICRWEVEQAVALNKRILPVILEDVPNGTVPDEIARLNYIFLRNEAEFKPALISIGEALKIDIDWVREHTRLAELAHRWDLATQLGAQPLRGKELDGAEQWLSDQPKDAPPPTEQQRRYIYQSRKAATRRQRVLVSASLAALLVVGVLGIFAWFQREAAIAGQQAAQDTLQDVTTTANILVRDLASDDVRPDVPTASYESVLTKAIELQTNAAKRSTPSVALALGQAQALLSLANYRFAQADSTTTITHTEAALAIFTTTDWPENQQVVAGYDQASAHLLLSRALFNLGMRDEAQVALTEAEQKYVQTRKITDRESPAHLRPYGRFANELAEYYAKYFLGVQDIHIATADISVTAFRRVIESDSSPAVKKQLANSLYTYAFLLADGDTGEINDTFVLDPPKPDETRADTANPDGLAALIEAKALIAEITGGETPVPVSLARVGDLSFLHGRYALRSLRNNEAAAHFAAAATAYKTAFERLKTDTSVFDRHLRAKEFEGIAWLRDDEPFKALLAALEGKRAVELLPIELRENVRGGAILESLITLGVIRSGADRKEEQESWTAYLARQERREVEFALMSLSPESMAGAKWEGKRVFSEAFQLMSNGKYAEGAALVDQSVATLKEFVDIFEFRCIASLSILQNLSLKHTFLGLGATGGIRLGDRARVKLEMEPYQNNCRSIERMMEEAKSNRFTQEELVKSVYFGALDYVLRGEFFQAEELVRLLLDRGLLSSDDDLMHADLLLADTLMFQGKLAEAWRIHTQNRDKFVGDLTWRDNARDSISFWYENGMQSEFLDDFEQRYRED